jgi:hypothetical protein
MITKEQLTKAVEGYTQFHGESPDVIIVNPQDFELWKNAIPVPDDTLKVYAHIFFMGCLMLPSDDAISGKVYVAKCNEIF